eukprot:CAMPEP_0172392506 /NCGR_PEP_ID=MMETSP1061-20121228/8629_1 /TAXON_ID=37318 /ORGANISM="Pseudo-nitzschia pungens, Strain cf. pungens" /LENGTH=82 /DNA_ID=CAMNT_0013123363 /DNA_START=146 /DNA_END=391 /DNA_ORIENTATION=-
MNTKGGDSGNDDYFQCDDDDDDMADLFSFGTTDVAATPVELSSSQNTAAPIKSPSKKNRLDSTDETTPSDVSVTNDGNDSHA